MLRNTGAAQSLILDSTLPFSANLYTGCNVLVRRIELGYISVLLHSIYLNCNLVAGFVNIGVRSQLHFRGVSMILGNYLAEGKVFPSPVFSEEPDWFSSTFPACAITCAQSQNFENVEI